MAVVLAGVGVMAQGGFTSLGQITNAWNQWEAQTTQRTGTELEVLKTVSAGGQVDVTIRNSGQVLLREFKAWDLVAQYHDLNGTYRIIWLPYTAANPPGNNQWTVVGIYRTAPTLPEEFQPGILDPGEEMVIRMILSPVPRSADTHKVVVGTLNGITASTFFTTP